MMYMAHIPAGNIIPRMTFKKYLLLELNVDLISFEVVGHFMILALWDGLIDVIRHSHRKSACNRYPLVKRVSHGE